MLTIMIIASALLLFMVALAIVNSGKSADEKEDAFRKRFEQRKKEIEEMKSWREERRKNKTGL